MPRSRRWYASAINSSLDLRKGRIIVGRRTPDEGISAHRDRPVRPGLVPRGGRGGAAGEMAGFGESGAGLMRVGGGMLGVG